MVDLNIELPEGFLDEEVRCGYRVTRQMKEVWAVELDLLAELARVCKKYNLKYFADSGTLIGAVREKGFIPWDDDIDLVMPRDDYEKLVSVANQEFKYPYFLQNTYSETEPYLRAHSQFRNSDTTGCVHGDERRKVNCGIFIDVFPIDIIPNPKSKKYRLFLKQINSSWKILSDIEYKFSEHKLKGKIFHLFARTVVNRDNFKKRFRKYEELCSKYNSTDFDYISYIAYSRGKEKHLWKREWFEKIIEAPFEFTQINIPAGYDGRLRKEYGDYKKPSKAPTVHGGVLFDTNRSYKEVLKSEQ